MDAIGEYFKLNDDGTGGWSLKATLVSISSAIGLIAARIESIRAAGRNVPKLRKCLFLLLGMAGPVLFTYAYFELSRVYVAVPATHSVGVKGFKIDLWPIGLIPILLIVSLRYSKWINVNFTSLHRFYRNRLAETYLLKQLDGVVSSTDREPRSQQLLSNMRSTQVSTAPYHLINAALNLPASQLPELRGRQCDFFLFSKHYCGSRVVQYRRTNDWETADPHLDLGTAVAISGAAAAPQMGMGSIQGGSFLLTLVNIRLGYWLRKPLPQREAKQSSPRNEPKKEKKTKKDGKSETMVPGPSYLWREAWNSIDEKSDYLNLSDGGHIENLGIYELPRRRCRYIIAVDGECDPNLDCPSLMRLQHFAAVDLGVKIEMDVERLKWIEVVPVDSSEPRDDEKGAEAVVRVVGERVRYSRGHFAVGRIHYPNSDGKKVEGLLIYVKLSITGNEPDYVHDYRRRFPEFPHQSTADQVFEDDQFEAYRCLGQHISDDLFSDELLSDSSVKAAEQGALPVKAWGRDLSNSFLRE